MYTRDDKRNPEKWIPVLETKHGSTPPENKILFFHVKKITYKLQTVR